MVAFEAPHCLFRTFAFQTARSLWIRDCPILDWLGRWLSPVASSDFLADREWGTNSERRSCAIGVVWEIALAGGGTTPPRPAGPNRRGINSIFIIACHGGDPVERWWPPGWPPVAASGRFGGGRLTPGAPRAFP